MYGVNKNLQYWHISRAGPLPKIIMNETSGFIHHLDQDTVWSNDAHPLGWGRIVYVYNPGYILHYDLDSRFSNTEHIENPYAFGRMVFHFLKDQILLLKVTLNTI